MQSVVDEGHDAATFNRVNARSTALFADSIEDVHRSTGGVPVAESVCAVPEALTELERFVECLCAGVVGHDVRALKQGDDVCHAARIPFQSRCDAPEVDGECDECDEEDDIECDASPDDALHCHPAP